VKQQFGETIPVT